VRDITARIRPAWRAQVQRLGAFIIWGIIATIIGLGTLVTLVTRSRDTMAAHRLTLGVLF
jgi:putative flippase GtrA